MPPWVSSTDLSRMYDESNDPWGPFDSKERSGIALAVRIYSDAFCNEILQKMQSTLERGMWYAPDSRTWVWKIPQHPTVVQKPWNPGSGLLRARAIRGQRHLQAIADGVKADLAGSLAPLFPEERVQDLITIREVTRGAHEGILMSCGKTVLAGVSCWAWRIGGATPEFYWPKAYEQDRKMIKYRPRFMRPVGRETVTYYKIEVTLPERPDVDIEGSIAKIGRILAMRQSLSN